MSGLQIGLLIVAVLMVLIIATAIFFPRKFIRGFMAPLLATLYRKQVIGLENLPSEGGYVVASNHVSWIDGILILWMLPKNVRFVVDAENFEHPITRYLGAGFDTILMRATNPKSIGRALKAAREGLNSGDAIGIFPEGTISRTGQLQAFKAGISKITKGTDAPVVPMWLDGMWGSLFSFSGGKLFWKRPTQLRRRLTLYIGTPQPNGTPLELIRSQVQQLGARATIEHRDAFPVLARRIIRVWRRRGRRLQCADSLGTEVSARDMLVRVLVLRRLLRREVLSKDEAYVGILLPPSVAGVAANVALALDRRITANLNYTVSSDVMNHCIADTGIKHVLTSEKFLSKLDLKLDAKTVALDSLREKITTLDKVVGFLQARLLPARVLDWWLGLGRIDKDDLLTIIFTSGSTGMPKGVMLSQANISHNVDAIERAIKLDDRDVVLGILPFFHSFGYAVTLWAVNTLGPAGVYHFNPLDSRQIGKLVQRYQATVLLGTPTFLRSYLRRVSPEQFKSLDVVVAGAEKMPADLFDEFEKKFGVRPIEGYGTTELSPLVSVNIPPSRSNAVYQSDRLEGSVGRPLPGISAKIVSPDDGTERRAGEDGMLLVTGPNVMRGYANQSELTEKAIQNGWYVTGDIANVDDQGFLHITGRLSRFSKIGGEMVPHVRIEDELAKLFSDGDDNDEEDGQRVCVTAVPDLKKGERLVVLFKPPAKDYDEVRAALNKAGMPNLFIPSADSFLEVDRIPLLGTGKLDIKGAQVVALEHFGPKVEP
ncbi:AMP-binding protein [Novipirellula artificiosorum]|uniref:Bifunctional protein Aas n=1 Tax=Novipirellula artificiosorum TaxID=2528016 RepID=A0A5C6DCG6_9BACT|nr:AMP-binding protein [Novipirellula artificiosorum]TWU34460.1 Bifunctional protein Aas [Novipirellula artificiosorum]